MYSDKEVIEKRFMDLEKLINGISESLSDFEKDIKSDFEKTNKKIDEIGKVTDNHEMWKKTIIWGVGAMWFILTGLAPVIYYVMKSEFTNIARKTIEDVEFTCEQNVCKAKLNLSEEHEK